MMTTTWDVIVVGGGIAGLTAGATASQAGASALVLEAHQPGGRARTIERDGFVFNMGGHALYVGGEGYRVLNSLGIPPKGAAPPLNRYKLLMDGHLHQMPVGPTSLLRTSALGKRSKASLGKLLAMLPRFKARDYAGESAEEFMARFDLRGDALRVLRAITRIATYGPDFHDLSAEAAITQLQRGAAKGVLYLDGGWATFMDALRAQTEVRSNTTARSVDATAGGASVTTDDGVLHARAVVIATGAPATSAALLPSRPKWGDIGAPLTAAALDVAVRGVPSPGYVLGVDDAVYATTQSPPARQAPAGDSVVAVIRYGATSAADDRPLMEAYLRRAGVRDDAVVSSRFLANMTVTAAIPRAGNGGFEGRPAIDATGLPNVYLAGDWVGRHGFLADASFASGHAAALAAVRSTARTPHAMA
jgi:phytoene dehydrogenase-like protein